MKKQALLALALLIILSTITTPQRFEISNFKVKQINIENNFLIKTIEIKNLLMPIYGKNIILLGNNEITTLLSQNSLIDSFKVKKKYPDTIKIKIFEKKPIAILLKKKTKFFISEKGDLIKFQNFKEYQNLPYVIGDQNEFKIIYDDLKKIKFPLENVKKYILYNSNRWDIEFADNKIIKLPIKNYIISLKNFLKLKDKNNFQKYKIFDYRVKNQLILK